MNNKGSISSMFLVFVLVLFFFFLIYKSYLHTQYTLDLFQIVKNGKKFEKILKNHCRKIEILKKIPHMNKLCFLEILNFEVGTFLIWKSYIKSPYNIHLILVKKQYNFCKNSWCIFYHYHEGQWNKKIIGKAFQY